MDEVCLNNLYVYEKRDGESINHRYLLQPSKRR